MRPLRVRDDDAWLVQRLKPLAVRRHIAAGTMLFAQGDVANRYFLIESGKVIAHRTRNCSQPIIRLIRERELFIFDCAGTHVANCEAVSPVMLLQVDRRRLDADAKWDPVLRGLLNAMHAQELSMLLESMGMAAETRDTKKRADAGEADDQTTRSRGRWRPVLVHQAG